MEVKDIKTTDSPFEDRDGVGGATRLDVANVTHLDSELTRWHGRVQIEYAPRHKILDALSVGEFVSSFASEQMTPEEATHFFCKSLADACEPMMLTVATSYASLGGVQINTQARFQHPEAQQPGPRIVAPH